MENRIGDCYQEKIEMFIMDMSDSVAHKNGEAYVHLEIQNYVVELLQREK